MNYDQEIEKKYHKENFETDLMEYLLDKGLTEEEAERQIEKFSLDFFLEV